MDKRMFPRTRRRLAVSYELDGSRCAGFTRDLSLSGLAVVATRLPAPGGRLRLSITAGDGSKVTVVGRVIRSRRALVGATALASAFALAVELAGTGYAQLLAPVAVEVSATASGMAAVPALAAGGPTTSANAAAVASLQRLA